MYVGQYGSWCKGASSAAWQHPDSLYHASPKSQLMFPCDRTAIRLSTQHPTDAQVGPSMSSIALTRWNVIVVVDDSQRDASSAATIEAAALDRSNPMSCSLA
jgi:hypothetical protein